MEMLRSVAFFGLARGGSSISCQLAAKAFESCGYKQRDIGGELYKAGIPLNRPGPDLSLIHI